MKRRHMTSARPATLAATAMPGAPGGREFRFVPGRDLTAPAFDTLYDMNARQAIRRPNQMHPRETIPCIPTVACVLPTPSRAGLVQMRRGIAQFPGVRRA